MAEIKSTNDLLGMNLNIPDYQRPYKWDIQNIEDLFLDITNAISDEDRYKTEFKYRIGTIILHKTKDDTYDVVDGQQRIISLLLLKHYLEPDFPCSLLKKDFTNKVTQYNIHRNYAFIREWFSLKSDNVKNEFIRAFKSILEVVVIYVNKVTEAFQLFDSQNTRGKALDPHDLLKAYHLREMKKYPYEMEHAVTKWEAKDNETGAEVLKANLLQRRRLIPIRALRKIQPITMQDEQAEPCHIFRSPSHLLLETTSLRWWSIICICYEILSRRSATSPALKKSSWSSAVERM